MKLITLSLLIILVLSCNIATADDIIYGSNGYSWTGNITYDNATTNPIDIVFAYSADFANRADDKLINNNTGKTKWRESVSLGLEIFETHLRVDDTFQFAFDDDVGDISDYNLTFTFPHDSSSLDFKGHFYSQSNTSDDNAYFLYFQQDNDKYSLRVEIANVITIIDTHTEAFGATDTFTIDAPTVTTGLKVYKNGDLDKTFPANASYTNGWAGAGGNGNSIFDDWTITKRPNGTISTGIIYAGVDQVFSSFGYNGSNNSGIIKIYANASEDGASGWTGNTLVQSNAADSIMYDGIEALQKAYVVLKYDGVSRAFDNPPLITNIIARTAADPTPAPNITASTSTDFLVYENVPFILNATSDQIGNWTLSADGNSLQTNTSVASMSYINSTASEGLHNYTAIVTNDNGTDSVQWNVTMVSNSWDSYIINETSTLVYFSLSNYTAGLQHINITWDNRANNGTANTSTLFYQNGTSITSNSTYVANSVLLVPPYLLPSDTTYYIAESTTWTLVAGSIFQDIIHTIYYNGTITYNPQPTISSINLSAIFEPRMEVL